MTDREPHPFLLVHRGTGYHCHALEQLARQLRMAGWIDARVRSRHEHTRLVRSGESIVVYRSGSVQAAGRTAEAVLAQFAIEDDRS